MILKSGLFSCSSEKLFYIPHTFSNIYFQCPIKKVPWSNNCTCYSNENKCTASSILLHFDFENYTVNTSSKELPWFIKFKRDNKNIKNPLHLKNGVFLICTPRKLTFPPIQFNRCDTEVTVTLPKDSYGYFSSKFKTVETEQISSNLQRICIVVINKLLTEDIVIKKNKAFGFFALESKDRIAIKYATETKKDYCVKNIKKETTSSF